MKNRMIGAMLVLAAGVFLSGMTGCAWKTISDGEVGVQKSFGKIADEPLTTGVHMYCPFWTDTDICDMKMQTAVDAAEVPSSEGLIFKFDAVLVYHILPANATKIRKTIGDDWKNKLVDNYFANAVRMVTGGNPAKAMYSEDGRVKISKDIKEMLIKEVASKGVEVDDVLFKNMRLPDALTKSIETKMKTEQEALQKEFELQKAQKDAEITIAKAKGTAEANQIIAGSITSEYLQYLWVEGIKDTGNQIIYVPTECQIPIMEAGRRASATDSRKAPNTMPIPVEKK